MSRSHRVQVPISALATSLVLLTAGQAAAVAPPTIAGPPDGAALRDPPAYALSGDSGATIAWDLRDATNRVRANGSWPPSPSLSVIDVPDGSQDGSYTFTATATDPTSNPMSAAATRHFWLDNISPLPPSIAGPSGNALTNNRTPTFSWSPASDPGGSGIASHSIIIDGTPFGASRSGFTPPAPLGEGAHSWKVVAADRAGNGSESSTRTVTVDSVAPTPPVLAGPTDRAATMGATLTFTWTPATDAGGSGVASQTIFIDGQPTPLAAGTTSFTPPQPLAPGTHSWGVSAADNAGNASASPERTFSVESTASTTSGPVRAATLNAKKLRPRAGRALSGRRPILRWPKVGNATTYNVQIFRMAGSRFIKVYSGFPRGNRLRVPAGKLDRGERYAWRVWSFRGRRPAKKPVGASFFNVPTLEQLLAQHVLRPKAVLRMGARTQVRWRPRPKTRLYRLRLLRDGERVFGTVTRLNGATVPGRLLVEPGEYRIVVELGVGAPRKRRFGAIWARRDVEVLTRAELVARRQATAGSRR